MDSKQVEEHQKELWEIEIQKCKESPYYFFTKYVRVNNDPVETWLTEEEFNSIFKHYGTTKQ